MQGGREIQDIRALIESSDCDLAYRKCKELSGRKGKKLPHVFYLGALSLFGLGHIRQAETWIDEFEKISPETVHLLYLKAYQNLHRARTDLALVCYTRILELDPSDTFADSLIEKLRRGEKAIQREIENPENFKNYFPGFDGESLHESGEISSKGKDRFRKLILLMFVTGVLVIAAAVYLVPAFFTKDPFSHFQEELPEMPSSGSVIPLEEFVNERPRFIYEDSAEALKDYASARSFILQGQVNSALRKIGKIELSNAGFEIKERATLLREFIPVVDPAGFQDSPDMEDVFQEPYILRGAQVVWTGQVVSVQTTAEKRQKIILSREGPERPPFVTFDIVLEKNQFLEKGEIITVFGIFEKVLTGELLEIKTLQILKRNRNE